MKNNIVPSCIRDWPWSSALERRAAYVAASGPSLGRKRPRRAAIAGELPHALPKTITISGSIERRYESDIKRGHRPDTKVYGVRVNRVRGVAYEFTVDNS